MLMANKQHVRSWGLSRRAAHWVNTYSVREALKIPFAPQSAHDARTSR